MLASDISSNMPEQFLHYCVERNHSTFLPFSHSASQYHLFLRCTCNLLSTWCCIMTVHMCTKQDPWSNVSGSHRASEWRKSVMPVTLNMVVGTRWAGLCFSETTDLLGSSLTTVSREKKKHPVSWGWNTFLFCAHFSFRFLDETWYGLLLLYSICLKAWHHVHSEMPFYSPW